MQRRDERSADEDSEHRGEAPLASALVSHDGAGSSGNRPRRMRANSLGAASPKLAASSTSELARAACTCSKYVQIALVAWHATIQAAATTTHPRSHVRPCHRPSDTAWCGSGKAHTHQRQARANNPSQGRESSPEGSGRNPGDGRL
eukprot:scaffold28332_cov31-Tisochrysis_lutea.AAC.13